MCEFISWVERRGKVYFITSDMLASKKGKEIIVQKGISPDDYNGHGTIRAFFGLDSGDGIDKEDTDFSTPDRFPAPIVSAIKSGKFRGLGIVKELLTQTAWAEYDKIEQTAKAEYEKIQQTAWAEYDKIRQIAWAEYDKIEQTAWAEYDKIRQTAKAEYDKIRQTAWAEYDKIRQTAKAECVKIEQTAFWDLFAIPESRTPNWR